MQLRLRILDPKSKISIWELDSHVNTPWGVDLKKTRDHAFDAAMNNLVLEVQQLSQLKMTEENSSVLTQPSHTKGIRTSVILAILLPLVLIGVTVGVAIHMHNEYNQQVQNMQPTPPPPGFP